MRNVYTVSFFALSCFACIVWGNPSYQDDTPLDKAKRNYTINMANAKALLLNEITRTIKEEAADGKLDAVKQLQKEYKLFEENNVLPTSPSMRTHLTEYRKSLQTAKSDLNKAYETAVKDLTKQLKIEQAEIVRNEWKEFEKQPELKNDAKDAPKVVIQKVKPKFEYQLFNWSAGEPPVRMIHKEDGFCYLTIINGGFQAGGESAQVYIGSDGYWYLKGTTGLQFMKLQAIAVTIK